ncbi:30S ribosomal protein S13 [bacterium]|nr:30S ribosomal protein S13 [bacterium]
MMRILGITIPDNKRLEIGLTSLYGIGRAQAKKILDACGVDRGRKVTEVTPAEEQKIRGLIETMKVEGDLRRIVSGNIKRLKDIKAYRGVRHLRHLPVSGQRTKTNSRTVRGNVRKTMTSGRRKVEKT